MKFLPALLLCIAAQAVFGITPCREYEVEVNGSINPELLPYHIVVRHTLSELTAYSGPAPEYLAKSHGRFTDILLAKRSEQDVDLTSVEKIIEENCKIIIRERESGHQVDVVRAAREMDRAIQEELKAEDAHARWIVSQLTPAQREEFDSIKPDLEGIYWGYTRYEKCAENKPETFRAHIIAGACT